MIIKGKIESVDVLKEGFFEKNGKQIPYTLYSVMIGGEKFTTFDKRISSMVGADVELEYEEESYVGKNGKEYKNKKLILPKDDNKDDVSKKIDSLIEKIDSFSESLKFIADGVKDILSLLEKDEKKEKDDFDVFLDEIK